VRTVTRVDSQLLAGSKIRFVASATIGTDHLDLQWLAQEGILVANAPGCNANAVAQYVMAMVVRALSSDESWPPSGSLGIVGAGHVGKAVAQLFRACEIPVLLCDPPLARTSCASQAPPFVALDSLIAESRWLTLHVPLTRSGDDRTEGLIDHKRLQQMAEPGKLVINSARGGVVAAQAWQDLAAECDEPVLAFDVWPGEPNIPWSWLQNARCWSSTTPHVAGYSLEGKWRATQMVCEAFVNWIGHPQARALVQPFAGLQLPAVDLHARIDKNRSWIENFRTIVLSVSSLLGDERELRELLQVPDHERGAAFEALRSNYRFRRENAGYEVWLHGWRQLVPRDHELLVETLLAMGIKRVIRP
jgi:erythronate-4-phosphate dehydrogenase